MATAEASLLEEGGTEDNATRAQLKDVRNSYGAKRGETEFAGWQTLAPNFVAVTRQTPGPLAGGAFGGHVFHLGLPAVPATACARGGGGGVSGHYSPNAAHAGRG